jgi:hypothetical protein
MAMGMLILFLRTRRHDAQRDERPVVVLNILKKKRMPGLDVEVRVARV